MATTKTIAIIGATGTMGSAIAKSLVKKAYRVLLFAKDKEKILSLFNDIKQADPSADAEITTCPADAGWEADIIIPAVPFYAEKEIAEKIRHVATGKIVISIANPSNSSFNSLLTTENTSVAEKLQELLPHSKVVKAFNTTVAADFSRPVFKTTPVEAFIAGNDAEAIETVTEIATSAGFKPVIAGELSASRILESMPAYLYRNHSYAE